MASGKESCKVNTHSSSTHTRHTHTDVTHITCLPCVHNRLGPAGCACVCLCLCVFGVRVASISHVKSSFAPSHNLPHVACFSKQRSKPLPSLHWLFSKPSQGNGHWRLPPPTSFFLLLLLFLCPSASSRGYSDYNELPKQKKKETEKVLKTWTNTPYTHTRAHS